jgi:hypothetical protein
VERTRVRGLSILAAALAVPPLLAAPAIQIEERHRLTLEFRPLTAATVEPGPSFRLEVPESQTATLELGILWPDPERPTTLRLSAERGLTPAGERVRLHAELVGADGPPTKATREITIGEEGSGTTLFEIARTRSGVLTVAVTGEMTRETSFAARPTVGRPVSFELEIRWLEAGEPVSLETNRLNTFLGQSVSYAFKLGNVGEAESIGLRLLPERLLGDALRIDVEVGGTLPDGADGLSVVARREQWLATSGTTSTLSLASGEPPTGFQFLVTPRF